jgi:AcrR family transcriptional regulator
MTPRSATTRCPLLSITSSAQLELRGRILTAAKLRFARFGLEETALSDIARLAGVPEKAVRKHFDDTMGVMVALQRSLDRRPTARGPRPRPGFRTRGNRFASARDTEAVEA